WVRACAVTADGKRAVSASQDKTLRVWELETGRELATLRGHTDWGGACAVTADGKEGVSASEDKTVRVWEAETGRGGARQRGQDGGPYRLGRGVRGDGGWSAGHVGVVG